jgi:YHS domain-containing protein
MGDDDKTQRKVQSRFDDIRGIGDTHDLGDTGDVDDTRSLFEGGPVESVRSDLTDSIDENDLTMVDPVCGNRVEMTSLFSASYRGRAYIFDTEECRDAFLASPEVYIAAA